MISFEKVTKRYKSRSRKKTVFDNLSFDFKEFHNIAILGKNGEGKSTMMRLISGSELPDSGRVVRRGRFSWPMGFSGGFSGTMTGYENIQFVSRIYNVSFQSVRSYVEDFTGLGDDLNNPIQGYSSGMRAKLAFGVSLAIDFDVYLIDEVMSVGDASFRKKSNAEFKKRSEKSKLILISHNMNTVRQYAEYVFILSNNKVRIFSDVEAGIAHYNNDIKG